MGDCRCKISLRLRWAFEDISPKDVTDSLGIVPQVEWTMGTESATPQGTLLGGKRENSYWSGPLDECPIDRLSEVLDGILDRLQEHETFIAEYIGKGGEAVLFVGLFGEGLFGECLKADVLRKLGNLGLDLSFEIYGDSPPSGSGSSRQRVGPAY